MIEFVPVTRLGVRHTWREIVHGIDELYAEHKGPWMPEDVYAELVAGKVTLYLMKDDEVTRGFFVARLNMDYDGPVMFVWIMWTEPNAFPDEVGFPLLDDLARSVGAKRIRHESPRKGWSKKGFDLSMYVYEREVKPNV